MCKVLQKAVDNNSMEDGVVCSLISLLYGDYYQ